MLHAPIVSIFLVRTLAVKVACGIKILPNSVMFGLLSQLFRARVNFSRNCCVHYVMQKINFQCYIDSNGQDGYRLTSVMLPTALLLGSFSMLLMDKLFIELF